MFFNLARSSIAAVALTAAIALTAALTASAQPRPPAGAGADPRAADKASARASLESFVKAFDARDAKALAAHWTAEGEYRRGTDEPVQGRAALEQAFGAFFAKTPEVSAEVET